jgi:deazaflavin-dependent oxidoreductase (nitroreductase family)
MFHEGRPSRLARFLNRGTATLASAGLSPRRLVTLEVRGRRSDRLISLPVVIADYEGKRYLVAMLGPRANWVKNVRAAGGRAVLRHGHRESVHLDAVDPGARAPILKRYLQVAPGARAHVPIDQRAPLSEFEAIADRFPVFQVRTDSPVRVSEEVLSER